MAKPLVQVLRTATFHGQLLLCVAAVLTKYHRSYETPRLT
jgi:hypothetical protein